MLCFRRRKGLPLGRKGGCNFVKKIMDGIENSDQGKGRGSLLA